MVVCRFYVEGKCKFGENCRNEHPRGGAQRSLFGGDGDQWSGGGTGQRVTFRDSFQFGQQGGNASNQNQYKWTAGQNTHSGSTQDLVQTKGRKAFYQNRYKWFAGQNGQMPNSQDVVNNLSKEVETWENSKMWPFSCLAADKDMESLPEFYDVSVDELRLEAYQGLKSGNIQPYLQRIQSLTSEFQAKRNQLRNMSPDLRQKLIACVEEARKKRNSGSSTMTSPFGNPQGQTSQNSFGQSSATASNPFGSSSSTPSNLFGQSLSASGSLFGNPNPMQGSSTTNSLFGKPVTGSGFGLGNSNQAPAAGATSSVFGSPSLFGKPPQVGNTGSVFGGQSSGGAFGQAGNTQTPSSNPFLAGSSGTQMSTPSLFGNQGAANQSGSLFGAAPNPGGQSQTGGGLFGQTGQSSAVPQGLFGKPATPAGPFSGGAQSGNTGTNLFGQPSTAQQSLFGKPVATPTPSANQQPGQSVFGNSSLNPGAGSLAPSTSAPAPTATAATANPGRYTPLEDLTDIEKAEFQAPSFTLGKIPIRPPPKEWITSWNTGPPTQRS